MNYKYSYSYKDLVTGELVEQEASSSEKLSLDELFLETFIFLTEKIYPSSYGGCVDYEGRDECHPLAVSELRYESATNFEKMEFKLISGQENLKKPRGFGKKS